jgi:acylphosphatase
MTAKERIVRVTISGRVQGVGYRAWTQMAAQKRGVTGWVRNLADGRVEAAFSGSADAVAALCEDCRRGPASARVTNVEIAEAEPAAVSEEGSGRLSLRDLW